MPSMHEIYTHHADRYDELVQAEDYQGNLSRLLQEEISWSGAHVIEAGVGTGRVTKLYLGLASKITVCDQSEHMLAFARKTLTAHSSQIDYHVAENTNLPTLERKADVFIEGWSFGHSVVDCQDPAKIAKTTATLIENADKNLTEQGTIIIIETLGTNVDTPGPPHPHLSAFYQILEESYHFAPHIIGTDYRFPSVSEAVRIMGFFFGEQLAAQICKQNRSTIPEWTGVWIKRK